jgi:hypothetical protein
VAIKGEFSHNFNTEFINKKKHKIKPRMKSRK